MPYLMPPLLGLEPLHNQRTPTLLTEVQEKLPVATLNTQKSTVNSYNTHTEFVDNNGKIVKYKSLSKKQKQLWEDYKLLQYDITAGKNYWKNN